MLELIGLAAILLAIAIGVWIHNVGLKNVETRLTARIDNAATKTADAVKKV